MPLTGKVVITRIKRLRWRILQRFGPPSNSLRRLAAAALRPVFPVRPGWRIGRSLRRVSQSRGLVLILVAVAFVPVDLWTWSEGAEFLTEAWQVVTGTIAIALAVQVFALDRFAGSSEARYGAPVLEFARKTGLLSVIYVGVAAILVNGVALLEIGGARVHGFAGTYSVALSALAILLIPVALPVVLAEAGVDAARRRRLTEIQRGVGEAVDAEARLRIASALLEGKTSGKYLRFEPVAIGARDGAMTVRAPSAGVVSDVHLGLLEALAEAATDEPVRLHKQLGDRVWPREALVTVPLMVPDPLRSQADLVVELAPLADSVADEHRKRLDAEALAVARERDIFAHEHVQEAYAEMLLTYARAWRGYRDAAPRFKVRFDAGSPPTDGEAISDLIDYTSEAAQGPTLRAARGAVYRPTSIAFEAITLGASDLVVGMARAQVEVYRRIRSSSEGRSADVAGLVAEYIGGITRYGLAPLIEDETREIRERESAGELLERVYGVMAEQMRIALLEGDSPTIAKIETEWSEVLRHWDFVGDGLDLWNDEQFGWWREQHGAEEVARAERLRALWNRLSGRPELERFGVAAWILERVRRSSTAEPTGSELTMLRGFGSVESVAKILDVVLSMPFNDPVLSRWTIWLIEDRGSGVFAFSPDIALLRAGLTLMVMRAEPERPPELAPRPWLAGRSEQIERLLGDAERDTRLGLLVPAGEVEARVRSLRQGVADATAEQRAIAARDIAATPLRDEAKSSLAAALEEAWWSTRIVPALVRYAAGAVVTQGDAARFTHRVTMPRTVLQDESARGPRRIGRGIGEQLAREEFRYLAARLREDLVGVTVMDDARDELLRQIAALRAGGSNPRLIFKSIGWQLDRDLGLRQPGAPPVRLPDWWGLPADAAHWYRGTFEGVPVFDNPELVREIVLVDLTEAGTWIETVGPNGDRVGVTFEESADVAGDPVVVASATTRISWRTTDGNAGRVLVLPAREAEKG